MTTTKFAPRPGTKTLAGAVVVQRGQLMFLGAIAANTLVKHAAIDTFDPQKKTGYQREQVMSRVRGASAYYEAGGRFPNPILANIRQSDFESVHVEVSDQAAFREALDGDGDWIGSGSITIPDEVILWVYDGQHRKGGLQELLSRIEEFDSFPVPLSITLGLTIDEEMTEFYEVNTNAKSVSTELAWELLRKRAASEPELARLLDEKGRDWIIKGQEVVDELTKLDGPWRDAIQRPNEKKVREDRLTIPQAQFVRSIKPVLEMPMLVKGDAATIAKIVNAYWKGIALVLPEPFDPSRSPKTWVIQKGPGAIALHRVLPQVIEVMRARGHGLADEKGYAEVMADLPTLAGQVTTEDDGIRTVSGAEFWLSGSDGVASGYTGDSGRKRLGVMIRVLLPRPSTEIRL